MFTQKFRMLKCIFDTISEEKNEFRLNQNKTDF